MRDLRKVPPAQLRREIDKDVTSYLLENAANADDQFADQIRAGLWLEPTRKVVLGAKADIGGALRSVAINGQWPQERLYLAAIADHPWCQGCLQARGTVWHRTWECPALRDKRTDSVGKQIAKQALAEGPQSLLFARGLVPATMAPCVEAPSADMKCCWLGGGQHSGLTGRWYTD